MLSRSFKGTDCTADGDGGESKEDAESIFSDDLFDVARTSRVTQGEERVDNDGGLLMEGRVDATRGEEPHSTHTGVSACGQTGGIVACCLLNNRPLSLEVEKQAEHTDQDAEDARDIYMQEL